jgi:hypothetical protein
MISAIEVVKEFLMPGSGGLEPQFGGTGLNCRVPFGGFDPTAVDI